MTAIQPNPFTFAQAQFDTVAELLGLDPAMRDLLRSPMRELQVQFPVHMDDGSSKVFKGFRVQYSDVRGPTTGGLRFHPDETMDTIRAVAAWMTWKCALLDLPMGGAYGGVLCNPKELSSNELQRLSRAYVRQVGRILGPEQDIPYPDIYTNPQIMAWMMDEYAAMRGYNAFGVMTGKPRSLWGSEGRDDATARGSITCVSEAAKALHRKTKDMTVAIQGFGNAGRYFARLGREKLKLNIVAVTDSRGGVYNPDGIDPYKLIAHKNATGSVADFPDAKPVTNEKLLELEVDILVPAALEGVITTANAKQVKAKIIAELANGPTTPEAYDVLAKNDVYIIPDLLCNAGGVTVSYFEMVQNINAQPWSLGTVQKRLDSKMCRAFHDVSEIAKNLKVNNRTAAHVVAIDRVAEAARLRGWL